MAAELLHTLCACIIIVVATGRPTLGVVIDGGSAMTHSVHALLLFYPEVILQSCTAANSGVYFEDPLPPSSPFRMRQAEKKKKKIPIKVKFPSKKKDEKKLALKKLKELMQEEGVDGGEESNEDFLEDSLQLPS